MITGFAIVSSDGYIADASGGMARLHDDEDFKRLQEQLSVPGTIGVMGRITHECHANRRQRERWILSGTAPASRAGREVFFNDQDALLGRMTGGGEKNFAILGGGTIYRLLGEKKLYDAFNLSVRRDILLGSGIALCPGSAKPVDAVMEGWGLARLSTETCPGDPNLEFRKYGRG